MDPPSLMNEGSFTNGNANAMPYNLAEIWQFPMNGGVSIAESGGGLGLRMGRFGHDLGQFGEVSVANHEVSVSDPTSLEQRLGCGGAKKRRDAEDDSAKSFPSSNVNGNGVNDNKKRLKAAASREDNHESKTEAEHSSGRPVEQNSQPSSELPKQDFIHVRARRGQATDSHSLAERARREKISERMRILQDLVPGCDKVIGKALVLDEIINYIQSLQHQVEFLSMKLEAVNSRMSPGIEAFPSKDFGQQTFDTAGLAFGSQVTREYSHGSSPEWLHMQVGGGFERTT